MFKAQSKKDVRAKGKDKNKALSAKQEVDGQVSEVELMSAPVAAEMGHPAVQLSSPVDFTFLALLPAVNLVPCTRAMALPAFQNGAVAPSRLPLVWGRKAVHITGMLNCNPGSKEGRNQRHIHESSSPSAHRIWFELLCSFSLKGPSSLAQARHFRNIYKVPLIHPNLQLERFALS